MSDKGFKKHKLPRDKFTVLKKKLKLKKKKAQGVLFTTK